MEANYFAILRLSPGSYSPESIDRQYRSVRRQIVRSGGPARQRRLDEALIARAMLRNPGRQAALRRRQTRQVVASQSVRSTSAFRKASQHVAQPSPGADAYAQFARMVLQHVQNDLLRFTARQRLMELAGGLGIGQFKANLIMAEVLHDLAKGRGNPGKEIGPPPELPFAQPSDRASKGWSLVVAATLALVLDVLALAWLVS